MRYSYVFIDGLVDAEVVAWPSQDGAPEHFACGSALESIGGGRWRCRRCEQRGLIRVAGASDQIPRQWREDPITRAFRPVPDDPREWESYLADCFPHGLVGMPADEAPGYPIAFNRAFHLLDRVRLGGPQGSCVAFHLWEVGKDHEFLFPAVDRLTVLAPGILAFHDQKRGWNRLDAHLAPEERQQVREWREWRRTK